MIKIYSHRLAGQVCCGECQEVRVAGVQVPLVFQVGRASVGVTDHLADGKVKNEIAKNSKWGVNTAHYSLSK